MIVQLFINNVEIDIAEGIDFPLTFSQSDAKSPQKRKRNSSKSINLPGTKKNNRFFMSAWDLSISDVRGDSLGFDFDPTLKYPARVLRNGKEIFNIWDVRLAKQTSSICLLATLIYPHCLCVLTGFTLM